MPERTWSDECLECHDVGWISGWCPGVGAPADVDLRPADMAVTVCGRTHPHAAHTHGCPCNCRATNGTFARHHQDVPKRGRG